ncbi:hypothetical protein LTR95_006937 [Oleoguttula sp. CCFEE 5521]
MDRLSRMLAAAQGMGGGGGGQQQDQAATPRHTQESSIWAWTGVRYNVPMTQAQLRHYRLCYLAGRPTGKVIKRRSQPGKVFLVSCESTTCPPWSRGPMITEAQRFTTVLHLQPTIDQGSFLMSWQEVAHREPPTSATSARNARSPPTAGIGRVSQTGSTAPRSQVRDRSRDSFVEEVRIVGDMRDALGALRGLNADLDASVDALMSHFEPELDNEAMPGAGLLSGNPLRYRASHLRRIGDDQRTSLTSRVLRDDHNA